jgi:hypothetical protein
MVGVPGAAAGVNDEDAAEATLVPNSFTDLICNVYGVPLVNPLEITQGLETPREVEDQVPPFKLN